ncbi:protein ROLLING AND ERECT LEAF 2-like isoform X2 [Miscanthus floridulus]|uniref:protein ROLLING AND ERECT LEAF 2-like isoform X2 n=1 Tax=Miscanthus floridulus TaxID=154761 RepID=UPI00345895A0
MTLHAPLAFERKRFVREALDGRCAFAAAHFAYIQSLRHTGFALKKFVEPEVPTNSSLFTSTSATPEPPTIMQKSTNLSPSLSHHASDSFSPVPSPLASGRFHVNHMKAGGNSVTTVKEKVLEPVTATLQTSSPVCGQAIHDLDDSSTFEAPPGTPPWDYFGLFQPVESQISFHDDKELGHNFENDDDIRRLREKEGIPELEEELEKSPAYPDYLKRRLGEEKPQDLKDVEKPPMNGGEDDLALSEDDFDNPTSESLVRMFKNRNDTPVAHIATGQSPAPLPIDDLASETIDSQAERPKDDPAVDPQTERPKDNMAIDAQTEKIKDHTGVDSHAEKPKDDTRVLDISMYESDETPVTSPLKDTSTSTAAFPVNGKFKEPLRDVRNVARDLNSCMKEIEILFIKASDSGKEVPRMLEADKVNFRPLLPEEKAPGSTASGFFATLFACCREEVPVPQPPPQAEVQYLTWHRSMSSLSSSSRNPLGTTSKEDTDGLTGNIFGGVYMNSGSHASTLDRLYAWERKLYDEVKASSAVCRQYDDKCRQLRHQESRGESQMSIDKTRAVVKDLHSRILVAIQRIDMISKNIEDLRDKELQPQLEELIGSLTRMWATMLECHQHQHDIIKLVSNTGNMKASIRSESQFQATLLLQVELSTLCSNFQKWIASHKAYLQSLNSWLLKCVKSLQKKRKSSRKKKVEADPITKYAVAPIFKTCESWINLLDDLPTDLEDAVKDLAAHINRYVPHQEKQRGGSKRILSLSHSGRSNGEMGEVQRSDPPMDLQSSLEIFLGKLEMFSNISLQKYMELKEDINKAKERYEKAQADQQI